MENIKTEFQHREEDYRNRDEINESMYRSKINMDSIQITASKDLTPRELANNILKTFAELQAIKLKKC